MIRTCKRCKALDIANGACVLGHAIVEKRYLAGIAIEFAPEIGICQKPLNESDLSAFLRAKLKG